jgi:hypothetical protein
VNVELPYFYRMSIIRFLLTVLVLSLQVRAALAQQKQTDTQALSWWCYFGTYRVADNWSIWTELQLRRAGFVNEWQQVLPRVALNYHYTDNVIFTAGYSYLWTYPYGEQPIPLDEPRYEHRPWQQVTLLHTSGKLNIQHRYRLEQRFLENWSGPDAVTGLRTITSGFELQNRMRYRFLCTRPITRTPEGRQKLFATVYDEIFINFGKNIGFNLFDQNRLGATLGYQLNAALNLQLGYMNQLIQKSNGMSIENNHALTVFTTMNIDYRKPKN